ncbi:MAG: peroxiredoxin [bacterium]
MPTVDDLSKVNLEVGQIAPDFSTQIQNPDGSIEDFNLYKTLADGEKVLLVFYPGDDTPGCTKQLCGIRDVYKEYRDLKVKVVGVNHADGKSHLKFIKKYDYPFGIVVDTDKSIRNSYGATKLFFRNITTKRSVFLIDTDGKILFIFWGQQNNEEILNLLKASK